MAKIRVNISVCMIFFTFIIFAYQVRLGIESAVCGMQRLFKRLTLTYTFC